MTTKTLVYHRPVFGVLNCRSYKVAGELVTSVNITNDVGGTDDLPKGMYRVMVTSGWRDSEIGYRCIGELLDEEAVEKSRQAGTTGYHPEDYRKYGNADYERALAARNNWKPQKVYFQASDFQAYNKPIQLWEIKRDKYGGDSRAINRWRARYYEDQYGNRYDLQRCLSACPPYFEAHGPHQPWYKGFGRTILVAGHDTFCDGRSWPQALFSFLDALKAKLVK